jgi:hypothetical protein
MNEQKKSDPRTEARNSIIIRAMLEKNTGVDRSRVSGISQALAMVQVVGLTADEMATTIQGLDPDQLKDFCEAISPLAQTMAEKRFDLIHEAVAFHESNGLQLDDPARMKDDAKWIAHLLATDYGMAKSDILRLLEKRRKDLFDVIPQSKSGLRNWWRELGTNAGQARGYTPRDIKAIFES